MAIRAGLQLTLRRFVIAVAVFSAGHSVAAVAHRSLTDLASFPGPTSAIVAPNGQLEIYNVDRDSEPHHSLYLRARSGGAHKIKIVDYDRHVEVSWNSDSTLFLVNEYKESTDATCLIFDLRGRVVFDVRRRLISSKPAAAEALKNQHAYVTCASWLNRESLRAKVSAYGTANPRGVEATYDLRVPRPNPGR